MEDLVAGAVLQRSDCNANTALRAVGESGIQTLSLHSDCDSWQLPQAARAAAADSELDLEQLRVGLDETVEAPALLSRGRTALELAMGKS